MNGGLAFNAVLMLLLDDRFPVTGFMLLDDGRAVAITVPVDVRMAFAHGYAGADRPGANANFVRHRGHRKHAHRCGNKQILLHVSSFQLATDRNDCLPIAFRGTCANKRREFLAFYALQQDQEDHGAVFRVLEPIHQGMLESFFVAMEAELWTSLADALDAVWPTALHAWYLVVNIFGNARQRGAARFNSEVER
jgi:hypothetical protein